jgi:zinc D-Ala-D-Ala dipeptidase
MKMPNVYRLLEEKMLSYPDYSAIPVRDKDEQFVVIPSGENLRAKQIGNDMRAFTGDKIFVRQTVLKKLEQAAEILKSYDSTLELEVVYGYRALEVQRELFEKYKTKLQDQYSGNELLAAVHRLVAVPEVAGHPAGAAVDIQITSKGQVIDFGTDMHEFVPNTFTFSPFVSKTAWENRQLLRRVMMGVGFAPFDGEWWHFSYGDKEWARYYRQGCALYSQVGFVASGLR